MPRDDIMRDAAGAEYKLVLFSSFRSRVEKCNKRTSFPDIQIRDILCGELFGRKMNKFLSNNLYAYVNK